MPGFRINEIMTGTHSFLGSEKFHPLHFHITWGTNNLGKYLSPFSEYFLYNRAKGFITVGNLVEKADCLGCLHMKYFSGRKIRYELLFRDQEQVAYRYIGEKRNLWPWNLHRTHFVCYGRIYEEQSGRAISESTVYFPFRQILDFLFSFRLKLAGQALENQHLDARFEGLDFRPSTS